MKVIITSFLLLGCSALWAVYASESSDSEEDSNAQVRKVSPQKYARKKNKKVKGSPQKIRAQKRLEKEIETLPEEERRKRLKGLLKDAKAAHETGDLCASKRQSGNNTKRILVEYTALAVHEKTLNPETYGESVSLYRRLNTFVKSKGVRQSTLKELLTDLDEVHASWG